MMCNCTASITTVLDEGTVEADVCYSHYGHDIELKHCQAIKGFQEKKRNEKVAKLRQGVSRQHILNDVRDNVGEFRRHHLLDCKDVDNIKKSFGLNGIQRYANDQQSVLSWIHECQNSTDNPILYFKPQGDEAEEGYERVFLYCAPEQFTKVFIELKLFCCYYVTMSEERSASNYSASFVYPLSKGIKIKMQYLQDVKEIKELSKEVDAIVLQMLQFIRAVRIGDWKLHLQALQIFTKYFFAHDRLCYACMVPLYLAEMSSLQRTDPDIYAGFTAGNWLVNKNPSVPFCALWMMKVSMKFTNWTLNFGEFAFLMKFHKINHLMERRNLVKYICNP